MAIGIVGKIGNLEEALKLVRKGLAEEGLDNLGILTHAEGSSSYTYENYFGPLFIDWRLQTRSPQPWSSDRFYEKAAYEQKPFSLDVQKRSESLERGHILRYLKSKGIRAAFCCPIRAARIHGILLFPLKGSGAEAPFGYKLPHPGSARQDMLATYAAMVGSCIDATESHLTAEGARMLVGHIGHEVNTPAIILGQEAKKAMQLARNAVPESDKEFHSELRGARDSVKQALLAMKKTMDLALSVAQGGKSSMQMHFQTNSLYRVLEEARDALLGEMFEISQNGKPREYRIEISSSCAKLPEINCDRTFLKQVLINLLRNGMKYSLPRNAGKPMVISVIGVPQTNLSILQISNWGIGIPPSEFDRIFKPFVRGSIHDRMKAIRGMGLGLFMASRIVAAHNGRLFCHRSSPTLDDPERTRRWEGFETTFELRIPHNILPGIRDYEWQT